MAPTVSQTIQDPISGQVSPDMGPWQVVLSVCPPVSPGDWALKFEESKIVSLT